MTKGNLGRKAFMFRAFKSIIQGRQGRNSKELKQNPQGNAIYWLTSSGLLNFLSDAAQDYLPRDSATHSGLGPPTTISNQENIPQTIPQLRSPLPSYVPLSHLN